MRTSLFCLLIVTAAAVSHAAEKPNIVVILSDDMALAPHDGNAAWSGTAAMQVGLPTARVASMAPNIPVLRSMAKALMPWLS